MEAKWRKFISQKNKLKHLIFPFRLVKPPFTLIFSLNIFLNKIGTNGDAPELSIELKHDVKNKDFVLVASDGYRKMIYIDI